MSAKDLYMNPMLSWTAGHGWQLQPKQAIATDLSDYWIDKTTVGISRRLHLEAQRFPESSRVLCGLVETADLALRRYDEVLDEQKGWSSFTKLRDASFLLIDELSLAVRKRPADREELFKRCYAAVDALEKAFAVPLGPSARESSK